MRKITLLCMVLLLSLVGQAQVKSYPNSSPKEVAAFWEQTLSSNKKYRKFTKNESKELRALRSEFKDGSLAAVNQLEQNGAFYEDDIFLTDYLTNLVQLLNGGNAHRNRTMATAKIMYEATPNACAYPDGTLVFNTRLLAMMDCEEELLGVVAHEMAHYMLEHGVTNYMSIKKSEKKKKGWANFATIAATAVGTLADVATGGDGANGVILGAATGIAVAEAIYASLEDLGYKFSQEQELEADLVATQLMEQLGVSKSYYASALNKLRREDYRFGREIVKTKKNSTHPALDERIAKVGGLDTPDHVSTEYDQRIAQALTIDAYIERTVYKDFEKAMAIFDRIERSTPLTLEDYLIKVPTMLDMSNTAKSNEEALDYLQIAMKSFKDPEIESLTKYEAMIYVRLKDKEQAKESLERYIAFCDTQLEKKTNELEKKVYQREKSWAENAQRRL